MPKNAKKTNAVLNVPRDFEGNTKVKISACIRWCFTLHNYTNKDIEFLRSLSCTDCTKYKYVIFSEEKGESGETPHLQGYFELKKRKRALELGFRKEYHFEVAKGTKEENIEYISKENGNCYINGFKIRKCKLIEKLRPWQKKLFKILKEEPDENKIIWKWDRNGGIGKSKFTKYVANKLNALVLCSKATDMKYGIVSYKESYGMYPDIVILDLPRSVDLEYLSYPGIEEIKNGCFFCNKYKSCMVKDMPTPHIVIFANQPPDLNEISAYKWDIEELSNIWK